MERMQDNTFDRKIKEKLEGLNPTVSGGLWAKIEAGLAEEPAGHLTGRARKKQAFRWISIAASLMIVGFAWWMYQPTAVIYLRTETAVPVTLTTTGHQTAINAGNPAIAQVISPVSEKHSGPAIGQKAPAQQKRRDFQATDNTREQQAAPVAEKRVIMLLEETEVPHAAIYQQFPKVPVQAEISLANKPLAKQHLENVPLLLASTSSVADQERPEDQPQQMPDRRPFGVSSILNFVVGAVDNRENKIITFTEDSEGSLNIDFKKSMAQRKRAK